jgi:Flp pilus assembly protein TadD
MASLPVSPNLPARRRPRPRIAALAAACLIALGVSGCLKRGDADFTGALGQAAAEPTTEEGWRGYAQDWGKRYDANPNDRTTALNYARALRNLDQRAQAVAVLQQAAIRAPRDMEILGAYGRALSDVGRFKEAAEVLAGAHLPERPDWRILSAQGTVADQLGDHAAAQRYYEEALKIVPGEPSVMSNLGLSYALAKRLPDAERTLRQASEHPRADGRVRQNLALVLGLEGKFGEAEGILRKDMPPGEASANLAFLKHAMAQPNSWDALRGLDRGLARRNAGRGDAPRKPDAGGNAASAPAATVASGEDNG